MSDSVMRQFNPEWSGELSVNAAGGKQQKLNYRFDLIDPHAIYKLANVLSKGAEKYGEDNWRKISATDHVNHCLEHLYAWLAGDKSEDHMGHALCRAMMAAAVEGMDEPQRTCSECKSYAPLLRNPREGICSIDSTRERGDDWCPKWCQRRKGA